MEKNRSLESNLMEHRMKIETISHELEMARNEIKDLRESNKSLQQLNSTLDTTKHSQDRSLTEY